MCGLPDTLARMKTPRELALGSAAKETAKGIKFPQLVLYLLSQLCCSHSGPGSSNHWRGVVLAPATCCVVMMTRASLTAGFSAVIIRTAMVPPPLPIMHW